MRLFSLLLLCSLASQHLPAQVSVEGSPDALQAYLGEKRSYINLSAEATDSLVAAEAEVRLRLESKAERLEQALQRANDLKRSLVQQLRAAGFAEDAVQAENLHSIPQTGIFTGRVREYQIRSTLTVRVANDEDFLQVARLVDMNPDITFGGLRPSATISEEMRLRLIREAAAQLERQEEALEESLDVELTLVSFATRVDSPQQPTGEALYEKARGFTESVLDSNVPASPIALQQGEVRLRMDARYLIEAR